jgi:hypothetical protein
MRIKHGNYQVVRACCTSGNCFQCRAAFVKSRRKRVMHMDGLSKTTAEQVAKNYAAYDAEVLPMPR